MNFWKRVYAAITAGLLCVGSVPVMQTVLPKIELTANATLLHHDTYGIFSFDEYFLDGASCEPGTGTHIWITGCDASVTSVEIPSEINGVPVTGISARAFQECTSLTDVTIPDSIIDIGTDAFLNTPFLAEAEAAAVDGFVIVDGFLLESTQQGDVVIPAEAGVKTITSGAFDRELTSIVLPEGLIRIGNAAFYFCEKLGNVTLPESLESIGDSAFYDCISMTEIVIPDSVTSIEESAFAECLRLTNVTLPSGLTRIENDLFRATNVTEINLPESLTYIGSDAFCSCDFTSLVIPDSVTEIAGRAFRFCEDLTSIVLPKNLTSIDSLTFYNCNQLTSIIIPEGVTSIGNFAFQNCTSLTDIHIPEALMDFGIGVFNETFWMEAKLAEDPLVILNGVVIDGTTCSGEVELPADVVKIGPQAFHGCTALTSITMPKGMTDIGNNAFQDCTGLTEVVLPQGVTSIGNSAFQGCTGLTQISMSILLTSIGKSAFQNCTGLTKVVLPEGVSEIGESAFQGCSSLTWLYIPDSVIKIPPSMLSGCTSLTRFVVPPYTTGIMKGAFYGCENLTDIVMPHMVRTIGQRAFTGCTALTNIYYSADAEDWKDIDIYSENEALDSATMHCGFSYTLLKDETLSVKLYHASLTEAEVPAEVAGLPVTSIGYGAFLSEKNKIISLTLPDSITKIERCAFENCWDITDVYYAGTIEQWEAISIAEEGNAALLAAVIHCSDGDIASSVFTGDIDGNQEIDTMDAYYILLEYAKVSAGYPAEMTEAQRMAADVNHDGKVDTMDAYYVLLYYAMKSVGMETSWEKLIG